MALSDLNFRLLSIYGLYLFLRDEASAAGSLPPHIFQSWWLVKFSVCWTMTWTAGVYWIWKADLHSDTEASFGPSLLWKSINNTSAPCRGSCLVWSDTDCTSHSTHVRATKLGDPTAPRRGTNSADTSQYRHHFTSLRQLPRANHMLHGRHVRPAWRITSDLVVMFSV